MPIDVDFATIRPWGRGQDTAFEELCCQVARAQALQQGLTFVRLGTPDGGVEGYSIDASGAERGLQAKFFLGSPGTEQWAKITSSVKKAIEKHPNLTALTIALPSDRADPRKTNEQWFMDKWNYYVEQWEKHAKTLGRTVEFHYMGKSEILEALSREEHAGRYRWWFERPLLSRTWLAERLDEVIEQVGPRYNRTLTVGVPAGRKVANFARLPHLLVDLEQHATSAIGHIERLGPTLDPTASAQLIGLAAALPTPITSGEAPTPEKQFPVGPWRQAWQALQTTLRALTPQPDVEQASKTDRVLREFNELADLCTKVVSAFEDDWPAYTAPAMLLWGNAGSGKTHLLCDTARLALERGQPAVLVLGQQLGAGNPWAEVMKALRFDGEAETFLQALSARAEASQQRALLIIDAINENNGLQLWPEHLAAFLTVARRFPWIGVILSVRTVAKDMILPDHLDETRLLQVEHRGFAEAPVAAVRAFFEHYRLPLPAAPPSLFRELSNPLMLRLFCQAASHDAGLLARPIPGLSRIIEAIFRDVDARARRQLGTSPYQAIARPCCEAVAAAIFNRQRSVLTHTDAVVVLQNVVPTSPGTCYDKTPLGVLVSEGLLAEDFVVEGAGRAPSRVVRFAFERINDHLAAEVLLADGFDREGQSPADIADEIARRLPDADPTTRSAEAYRLRTLLEALAVAAPEHVGVELPEIAEAMKRAGVTFAGRSAEWVITGPWLRGLLQRESSSFTDNTRQQLADLVLGPDPDAPAGLPDERRREAISRALLLTIHPDQPLGNGWLHDLLAPMAMAERDRRWTAQLRGHTEFKRFGPGPYQSLVSWARSAPPEVLNVSIDGTTTVARLTAEALLWALPSPDRFLRDAATRAMVATTAHDPQIIPALLQLAAGVDDGYVTERVLAAAFAAITMRAIEPEPAAATLRAFVERAGVPIHVLARDYLAAAVSHLAEALPANADVAHLRENAMPPYPANWPGPLGLPDFEQLKGEYPRFRPDADTAPAGSDADDARRESILTGYGQVIGSLDTMGDFHSYVMHVDRAYGSRVAAQRIDDTSTNPLTGFDLGSLPGWIFARVLELGWTPQAFREVDTDISRSDRGRSAHKEERFGKKYQWLAWHEALARLSGTHKLRDRDHDERETPYEGAWQLDARDFDPTHLLDRPRPAEVRWWQELWQIPSLTVDVTVAPDKTTDDGPVAVAATEPTTEQRPWWLSIPEVAHPAVPLNQDPVVHLSEWATDPSDLPDLSEFLVVNADLMDWPTTHSAPRRPGRRYRVLSAYRHLIPQRTDRDTAHADLTVSIDGALIWTEDLSALQAWTSQNDLATHSLDVSFTDELFLGEWPTGAVYRANTIADFRPERWTDAIGTDSLKLGIPAVVMTERYCWEGSIFDCSLPATLNVHLLTSAPAGLFPGLRHHNGAGVAGDGQLLHLDPEPWPATDGGLLIDEALLASALEREGLALLQIIRQSKHVNPPDHDHRFAGLVTQTRLIASIGTEQLCDVTRTHVHPPRLDD
ncbi:hypothetical protein OG400_12520 [Micromonospora ureilytica]|uniref:hypothetical protein n=1 Tax=Micromonospora ureilytica TaxID=709868 RepID=UPI002E123FFB|nr:hypothetical protein OG400_12520 [Micromonospora ureilytica]